MPFRKPIEVGKLRQIAHRQIDDADATALIWEVARLKSLVAQAKKLLPLDPGSAEAGLFGSLIDIGIRVVSTAAKKMFRPAFEISAVERTATTARG